MGLGAIPVTTLILPRGSGPQRGWLAWCTLWRCTGSLRGTIADIRDREVELLARTLGVSPFRTDLTGLMAMIDGLTAAVCAPVHPVLPAQARAILEAAVAGDPRFAV